VSEHTTFVAANDEITLIKNVKAILQQTSFHPSLTFTCIHASE